MPAKPTLSVIMANYNHARYLPTALAAILGQSRAPDEIVIVDDGSTDDSVEVIRGFMRQSPLIRLERHERNQGVVPSINRALDLARGEYVYAAGADDEVLPGFFAKSMEMLTAHPAAALCCGHPSYVLVDDDRGTFVPNHVEWSDAPCYLSPRQLVEQLRVKRDGQRIGRTIYSPSSVCKRQSLLKAGKFLPDLRWLSDWFVDHVIAFREGICFIPETMVIFYKRPGAYSMPARLDQSGSCTGDPEIVRAIVSRLTSPEYRDVCPAFLASEIITLGNDLHEHFAPFMTEARNYFDTTAQPLPWPVKKLTAARMPARLITRAEPLVQFPEGQSRPRLSVIMANYNHSEYLRTSISAILSQNYAPHEVIVVDDCSTDDSVTVLNEIASRHPSLRVERNSVNRGVNATANRALDLATGDYVYAAGADDEVFPDFFEKAMALLVRNPQAGLCCGFPSTVIAEGNQYQFIPDPQPWGDRARYIAPRELARLLVIRNDEGRIGGNIRSTSVIYRRASLLAAGKFIADFEWQSDWFANYTIAFRDGICFIPQTLGIWIQRTGGYGATGRDDRAGRIKIQRRMLDVLLTPEHADSLIPMVASGLVELNLASDQVSNSSHRQLFDDLLRRAELYLRGEAESAAA